MNLPVLKLQKLKSRKLQQDLIWCYKILFGYVNIDYNAFFQQHVTATRGHPYKLYKHHNYSNVRACFLTEQVINIWNLLLLLISRVCLPLRKQLAISILQNLQAPAKSLIMICQPLVHYNCFYCGCTQCRVCTTVCVCVLLIHFVFVY